MYKQDCVKAHNPRISSGHVIASAILCQGISNTELNCLIFNCQFNFFSNLFMHNVDSLSFHAFAKKVVTSSLKKPQAVEHV